MLGFRGLAAVLIAAMCASGADADDLALLIGNERYDNYPRIRGMSRDMRNLEAAYEAAGFEVLTSASAPSDGLYQVLEAFEAQRSDNDRLVIHYMGHIAPSSRTLRLVPRDMSRDSLMAQARDGVPIDVLYELLSVRPGKAALIVGTPYDRMDLGLLYAPPIPNGLLVIGGPVRAVTDVVRSDLLGDHMSSKALKEKHSSLVVTGYVSDVPFHGEAPAPGGTRSLANDAQQEMADWRAATRAGRAEDLEGYLEKYPNGMFAGEAQARLDALEPPEKRIEDALNLSRSERRKIQRNLTLLGYDTRGVDGIFGNATRNAVKAWQGAERFRVTGYLDIAQIRVLETAAAARQQELDREAEEAKQARDAEDLDYWQRTGSSGQEDDLRAYLREFPEGLFASQARRALEEIEANQGSGRNARAEAVEARLGLNNRTRLLVEQRLAGLQIDPGPVDGRFDRQTRRAIAAFQRRVGLEDHGYLNNETVGQLIASVFR